MRHRVSLNIRRYARLFLAPDSLAHPPSEDQYFFVFGVSGVVHGRMARFAGLGLEPILADSDDDEGDMSFRRGGFGMRGGDNHNGKGGNDAVRLGSFDRHDHRQQPGTAAAALSRVTHV